MPSPARTMGLGKPCWRRWSERTCSWSRSTIADAGIATTISLPTCCARACWTSSPNTCRSCTGGRVRGSSATARRRRRSATRWRPHDFSKAADLIELAAPALRRSRQEAALLGWLRALPDELLRLQAGAQQCLCRRVTGERQARGRRGAPAGCRAVARTSRPIGRHA